MRGPTHHLLRLAAPFLTVWISACSGVVDSHRLLLSPAKATALQESTLASIDSFLLRSGYHHGDFHARELSFQRRTFHPAAEYTAPRGGTFRTYRDPIGAIIVESHAHFVPPFEWEFTSKYLSTRDRLFAYLAAMPRYSCRGFDGTDPVLERSRTRAAR